MINFFITDNNWFVAIPIVVLFVWLEISAFRATTDIYGLSDKIEMRAFLTLLNILISMFLFVIPAGTFNNQVDNLNADNTVVQNYKLSKSTNDGLVNEDVIIFTKRKDTWYDQNVLLKVFKPLQQDVKFIVIKRNRDVIELQKASGNVLKVTEKKYPKLWKSLKMSLTTDKTQN